MEQHISEDVEEECAAGAYGNESAPRVHHRSSGMLLSASDDRNECAVCAEEPSRLEQVWGASCRHGACGECMFKHLTGRAKECMHCRAKLTRVVDENGKVYHHYEWVRRWKTQRSLSSMVSTHK